MTYCYTKIWKTATLSFSFGLAVISASAQMKLGGNNESRADAILELSHTKKGLLLPRIAASALTASPLDTAAPGMIVYNSTDNNLYIRKKTGPATNAWVAMQEVSGTGNYWAFNGNTNINPAINFLGSTNAQPLLFKTNNTEAARISANGRVGIGTDAPNARLHVNGSLSTNLANATGDYTMADSTNVVVMNNTADATFTLQSAAGQTGRAIEIVAYNTGNVNFTGANIKSQGAANPTIALSPGYSLRLVSNGTDWVVSGKQRSGMPMYLATTAGAGEGEVLRDYNNYLNKGSSIVQTDVLGAPINPIPNESAWFSMMMQAVGSTYFGQFNLNDHNAYFRGGEKTNVGTSTWYKFLSHPAKIKFSVQERGTDSVNFVQEDARAIVFSTANTPRVSVTGEGATRFQTQMIYNVTNLTAGGDYDVSPTDYTIVTNINANTYVRLPDPATCIGRVLVIKKMPTNNSRNIRVYPANNNDRIDDENAGDYITYTGFGMRCWTLQATGNNQWIVISQF
ncbi:hypothetical protein ACFOTA_22655 [Chitinophaga sp. GCM10012297]|uniref:SH3 domain-containing protein n=1 Tax=Chitinophaga chungangae TaxID=2821488 RepID=A0ABS3YK49_9BACT|nr:hypothetical protein [Chitinophaga chungangae]MBO9155032.1 hypothetical protein [Chitinophaga chungangae]